MSNTNSKSDDHRELADIELDGVTGGLVVISVIQVLIASSGEPPTLPIAAMLGAISGAQGGAGK
jgi:hypothetical protein